MSEQNKIQQLRDTALINELLLSNNENACVEFKHNNSDKEMIGKLISALSNSARIMQQDFAYIVWGVEDETKKIVGTTFQPETKKVGNQVFEMWLSIMLQPRLAFNFRVIDYSGKLLVLLEIPAAIGTPVEFNKTAYVRIGSATPRLSDFPEHFQKLINNLHPYNWERAIAKSFLTNDDIIRLLDYTSYFKLTNKPLPNDKNGILEHLEVDNLIKKDVGKYWNITNLGAILFAENLDDFDISVARKGIRFVSYDGNNKSSTIKHRLDAKHGYARAFESVISFINNLLPINEVINRAQRKSILLFPEIAIRETIANALIHQDMTIRGTGPLIELFHNRLEITNPGKSLIQTDRMIDLPPRSRNEALASLMRRMGFCEEQGTGLDKVIMTIELHQLPPPKFQELDNAMRVILFAPYSFAKMTMNERVRACYQHATIKYIEGKRMKNITLCERFGIDKKNAAQATKVINKALEMEVIKIADPEHPRSGYEPIWA